MYWGDSMKKNQMFQKRDIVHTEFGVWWVQLENGTYYIHQSKETKQVFGHSLNNNKRVIFSEGWKRIADKVVNVNPDYEEYINDVVGKFEGLIRGEYDSYVNYFPWFDQDGNLIWIENQLLTIRKENDVPTLIVGSSIDITEQMDMTLSMTKLEEANERAIHLANILVWSIDYSLHPKGDLYYANDIYLKTLGIEVNKDGFASIEQFNKSEYPDDEGRESLVELLDRFNKCVSGELDEYYHILVKHRNFQTGEAVYLEHNTKVEKRNEDGSLAEIGGYVIDVTERLKMERENRELSKENEQLIRAYELAVKSGRVMIWYIDTTEMDEGYYYGNEMHTSKLGIERQSNGLLLMDDFSRTVYTEDEEGKQLNSVYANLKAQTYSGLNSFEKVIVKHQNIKTKELIYLEHNYEAEKRSKNGDLLIRGGFMTDVTDEVNYQKHNDYLLKYDAMTDLLNRNSFDIYINSTNMKSQYGLIVVDIDGLKFINDAFGHMMGDKAIRFTANKLKEQFSSSSEIFRIGGDEYTIISDILEYDLLEHKIQEVKEQIKEFYEENSININISSGIEVVNDDMSFSEAFIDAENLMYRRKLTERSSRKSRTMETVLETLNQKTQETRAHCERMGNYAVSLMKKYGYHRASDFEDMRLLCKVHDIGKITVSEELLSKPGVLTKEEYVRIRNHSEAGYKIVRNIVESDDIAYGVLYHHERIDGKGYPFGLMGDEIPDFAKIVSICDAFDVMITGRSYSKAKKLPEVIEELRKQAGTQFDEELVELFIEIIEKEKL